MNITLRPNQVGLIVRGKRNDSHAPGLMEQHADCILSSGEPIGYFGGEGAASSGSSSGSWNSSGLNMRGFVADFERMKEIRPYYVDLAMAKDYQVVSTALILDIDLVNAQLFDQFWSNLKLNPGAFYLLGKNCSSHASKAFVNANIVSSGIPGLDTPNNLYLQLKEKLKSKATSYSGYIGFTRLRGTSRFEMRVDPAR